MHIHHMIPKHSKYFEYLGDVKEDGYYKVELTQEGHSCQHDILYRVFGNHFDKLARNGLRGDEDIQRQVSSVSGMIGGKVKPSEESREKMRQAKLGRKLSEEHKRKISKGNRGVSKTFSEEHKQNISDSLKGNSRRKNGKKTYKPSDETKQKISEANRGKKKPPRSEQHKKNASEAAKRAWQKRKNML